MAQQKFRNSASGANQAPEPKAYDQAIDRLAAAVEVVRRAHVHGRPKRHQVQRLLTAADAVLIHFN